MVVNTQAFRLVNMEVDECLDLDEYDKIKKRLKRINSDSYKSTRAAPREVSYGYPTGWGQCDSLLKVCVS
eukprot:76265-Amorphochlora_amoeboformis.AAC.1